MTIDQNPRERRVFLQNLGIAALVPGALATFGARAGAADKDDDEDGQRPAEYTLPDLPYKKDALDGFLSAEILELHHGKHHAGYVKGLNRTLAALDEAAGKGDLANVKHLERELAFHGSGHALHSLYWNSMSPKGGGEPQGVLQRQLVRCFGSVDAFRKLFAAATTSAEASGWGLLAFEPLGNRLVVLAAESHQQMGFQGAVPILACDVWEHAYYLRYQNKRAEYVDKFFDVIDWSSANDRLVALRQARRASGEKLGE